MFRLFDIAKVNENTKRIEYFNTICNDITLQNVFRNKQLYGCTYPVGVEDILEPFIVRVEEHCCDIPEWLHLLD